MGISDDGEPHLHESPSPNASVHASNITEPAEEVDIDEEKVAQDSENSDFGDGKESDGIASVRGQEVEEDCESPGMWDINHRKTVPVQNSEDIGLRPGLEHLSFNDSVSLTM